MIKSGYYFIKSALCAVIASVLGLALVSYSSFDPSFNSASDNEVYNILGHFGSYIADSLIQLIGLSSTLLVIGLFIWAKQYFSYKRIPYIYLKLALFPLAIITCSLLLSYLPLSSRWPLYIGMGGITGDIIRNFIITKIPNYLAAILALPIFVLSYGFICGASFNKVIASILTPFIKLKELKEELKGNDEDFLDEDADDKIVKSEIDQTDKMEEEKEKTVEKHHNIKANISQTIKKLEVIKPKSKKQVVTTAKQPRSKKESGNFILPSYDLLVKAENNKKSSVNHNIIEANAKLLKKVLADFGVEGEIIKVKPGPVVTLYELEPSPGTKSSRVIGLADDIARSMSAVSARISVVPGKNVLGIELPNHDREIVYLRELMETDEYQDPRIKLPMILGKDIGGEPITTDLSRMPHLLVAGTTGSGKSVAINAMILSFIYRLTPEECKFIMIDPKMLELSVYEGIPHLLSPVVTEPAKAVVALKWAVKEMEERYRSMSYLGVRNIAGYNKRIEDAIASGEKLERQVQTGFNPETGEPVYEKQELQMKKLPFIVVIVDEMADLMLTAGKDIESSVQRLAQMARAAGIHMIMATQRPSVDVITGVIKANFPTRISFQVTSRIDSRTILGEPGAEMLLGMGDMLYMAGGNKITRVHGPFVDDKEVDKVVSYLKSQGSPAYLEEITKIDEATGGAGSGGSSGDDLYDQAVAIVIRDRRATTSYIQRQLKIGYNRAADIIERMEREGVVGQAGSGGKREILVN